MRVAKLPKEHYSCKVCSYSGYSFRYVMKTYEVLPKTLSEELIVCNNCALREHGNKNRIKLQDIIEKRTKIWQKKKLKREHH